MNSNLLAKIYSKKVSFVISYLILGAFLFTNVIFAQDPPKIEGSIIAGWIEQIIDVLAAIFVLSALAMGLFGAYMWMTSTGDPSKVKAAQGTLTWAIIGLVFSLLIRAMVSLLFTFLTT